MYYSIDQIKEANARRGHHFFEPATMRFFRSRIASYEIFGGRYFVTSEQFENSNHKRSPRRYTIRRVKDDGSIDTVGDFQAYPTVIAAKRAAQRIAGGKP